MLRIYNLYLNIVRENRMEYNIFFNKCRPFYFEIIYQYLFYYLYFISINWLPVYLFRYYWVLLCILCHTFINRQSNLCLILRPQCWERKIEFAKNSCSKILIDDYNFLLAYKILKIYLFSCFCWIYYTLSTV